MAGLGSSRLGAGSMLSSDIAEMVAFHVRGFDHLGEQAKVAKHGEDAAAARLQFRPPTLPPAGQKPEATGILLEGHPETLYCDVYRLHSEHKGWPVLKSARGQFCYHYAMWTPNGWDFGSTLANKWMFDTRHRIFTDRGPRVMPMGAADIKSEGPLPVGAHTWRCFARTDVEDRTLTVTLLRSEAEVVAAEQRIQAAFQAVQAPTVHTVPTIS
eukprot:COSAG04_NODE_1333_length_7187_cov_15.018764_2_plen_213_part_00